MATNTYVEIHLDEAKKLADYTGIDFDIRTAREFAKLLQEEQNKPQSNIALSDPLMVATIIRYARAFASGVRVRIDNEDNNILTSKQRAIHERIITLRDKFIAHSVNAFEESQPIARYWEERVQEEGITSIECNHGRVVGLSQKDLQDIIDLSTTWLNYVSEKLAEEKVRLLEIVRKIPLEQLLHNTPKALLTDISQPSKRRAK